MLDSHGFDLWAGEYDAAVRAADGDNLYPFAGYRTVMNAVFGAVMARRPADVLDVGVGTGTLAAKLYDAGNRVTGIDFSGEMLRAAKAKMPDARLIQWDFTHGLPTTLAGEKFDFIVSTYALHHLADAEKPRFLLSLLGYLRGGGAIMIGDVGFPDRAALERCRASCGGEWDDEEDYFVFAELEPALRGHCAAAWHQASHCAGILELRHF